jgi:hypothetical protein
MRGRNPDTWVTLWNRGERSRRRLLSPFRSTSVSQTGYIRLEVLDSLHAYTVRRAYLNLPIRNRTTSSIGPPPAPRRRAPQQSSSTRCPGRCSSSHRTVLTETQLKCSSRTRRSPGAASRRATRSIECGRSPTCRRGAYVRDKVNSSRSAKAQGMLSGPSVMLMTVAKPSMF